MHDKNIIKRALAAVGTFALKYSGGINFDAVQAGWYLRNGYPQIYSILTGGLPAWSGESVSIETALNHSAVWACNKIISESIGFIPAVVMQKKGDTLLPAEDHPMHDAMLYEPNEEITAQAFSETLTSHCVMQGNGYAFIDRRSSTGTAIGMRLLYPNQVFPDRERDGARRLIYVLKESGIADKTFTVIPGRPHDIFHLRGLGWDGMRGYSVITMARQSIGSAIAAERNVARFWATGGRKPYNIKLANKFRSKEEGEEFRSKMEQIASQPNKVMITEPGWEYTPIEGVTMKESQMLESRVFTIAEISRWFSVSPHLLADLSRATFSNIEHLFLEFKQLTLNAWINRWEQEFRRCVLTDAEKSQGYRLRLNFEELMRGDFKTRMEGYSIALQNGIWNQDECRANEHQNKIPNGAGSHYHMQLNMQNLEDVGKEPATAPAEPGKRNQGGL
jgi:HK97 family phage portal protein